MVMLSLVEPFVIFLSLYILVVFIMLLFAYENELFRSNRKTKWRPLVSVVIPAYNEENNIRRCIESLLNANYPRNKIEIIVVDDGSKDRTAEIASSYKGVIVLKKPNSGKADSLNYGIKHAKGEIIATLDADSYITKDAILKMLPLFSKDAKAVTAAVLVDNPKNLIEQLQEVEYVFTIFSRKVLEAIDAIHVTPGPFSMFRREVFEQIGGFDRNNILEDQEIAMRMQKYNLKIRASTDAVVYTKVPENMEQLLKQRTRWHRGGLRNSITYLELVSPKYGDLGVFVMPLQFVSIVTLFLIFVFVLHKTFSPAPPMTLEFLLFYTFSPLMVCALVILMLTFLWVYYGAQKMGAKLKPHMVFTYVVSYAYLITLFWASAFLKEITGSKLSW
ncbi:MAG: glycosyltransferase [Candidatus Anstonellales archaeon]